MANKSGVIHYNDWDNSYIPNILKEIYLDRVYEPYLPHIKDKVVLDLGMNIGLWSLYASRYAKEVHGFEPAHATFELASRNLAENNTDNVAAYPWAITDKSGRATLYHNTNSTMNSTNPVVNNKPGEEESVAGVQLDEFVKLHKIDHIGFAKIDVEGTEDKLFASESFSNIAPILDAFVYEWHSWCQANPNTINAGLRDLGYSIKQIPSEATIFGAVKI